MPSPATEAQPGSDDGTAVRDTTRAPGNVRDYFESEPYSEPTPISRHGEAVHDIITGQTATNCTWSSRLRPLSHRISELIAMPSVA